METGRQLDPAGSAVPRSRTIRSLVLLVALACSGVLALAQTFSAVSPGDLKKKVEHLSAQERWEDITRELESAPTRDADLEYYYGIALAQLGREHEARTVFLAGFRRWPHDKRFPIELGGLAFRQQNYAKAAAWLRDGLRVEPADPYANEFLGTVYFLQDNLEAALKYWNRVGKPEIERINPEHPLQILPSVLDRALEFAPSTTLLLAQLRSSEVRIEGLEIFPAGRFQLSASEDGKFDVILNFQERNGWGVNKWEALLSTLSGAAYQT